MTATSMVSLLDLSDAGRERMLDRSRYSVCAFLEAALQHRECNTWVELIETLYEERWPLVALETIVIFLSRNFPFVHVVGRIDPLAVATVLRAAQVEIPPDYKEREDQARMPTRADRVTRNLLYLGDLYRKGKFLQGSLDDDMDEIVLYDDRAVLHGLIAPADMNKGKISSQNLALSFQKFCGVDITEARSVVRLVDCARDVFSLLFMKHGKPPLEQSRLVVEWYKAKMKRLRGTIGHARGSELAKAQHELAALEELARTVEAAYLHEVELGPPMVAAKPVPVAAPKVKVAAPLVEPAVVVGDCGVREVDGSALMAEVHRVAGLLLRRLERDTILPANIVVGWTLKKIIQALVDEPGNSLVTEVIGALTGRGLRIVCQKPVLQAIYEWEAVQYRISLGLHEPPNSLNEREVEKFINGVVQDRVGVTATYNWIASHTQGLIVDDARDLLVPVVAPKVVALVPVADAVSAEIIIVPKESEIMSNSQPDPVVVQSPVATVDAEQLPEQTVSEVVTVLPVGETRRIVSGSLSMAEIYRVARLVVQQLEEGGWPRGILNTRVLALIVRVVQPDKLQPATLVAEMNNRFWHRLRVSVYSIDDVQVKVSTDSWSPRPIELSEADIKALVGSIVNQREQWMVDVAHILAVVPGAVISGEPTVEPLVAEAELVVADEPVEAVAVLPVEVAVVEVQETAAALPVADVEESPAVVEEQAAALEVEEVSAPPVVTVLPSTADEFQRMLPMMIELVEGEIGQRSELALGYLRLIDGKMTELAGLRAAFADLQEVHRAADAVAERKLQYLLKLRDLG